MNKTKSRLLFRGGPIYPMNGPRLDQSALLVGEGAIQFVGAEKDLAATEVRGAEVIQLDGRPLFPGFCDGHLHLLQAAEQHSALDFRGLEQISALQERLRQRADQTTEADWVVGFGWERKLLFEQRPPEIKMLDHAAPDHPVFLLSKDAHSAWLNSRGMERLRTLASLPAGCVIDRRGEEPTGLVFEGVLELQRELIPPRSEVEQRGLLGPFVQYLHAQGITTVHDHESPADFRVLKRYQEDSSLRVRTLCHLIAKNPEELLQERSLFSAGVDHWFCPGGAKVFMDGSLGSLTAAVSEPYLGTSELGLLNVDAEVLSSWLRAMAEVGTHGVFHVIGDRAAELVLQGLDRVDWPAGTLHRFEHAQLLSRQIAAEQDLERIVFSVQPSHLWGDREIAARHLSPELNGSWAYAYRTMLERGGGLIFGSDAPVEDANPWPGIQAAVTRLAGPGMPAWNPDQALTLMDAIAAHTINPQRLHRHCFASGVLTPGAPADLVVFGEDPFAVAAQDPGQLMARMAAELTFVDGDLVYEG